MVNSMKKMHIDFRIKDCIGFIFLQGVISIEGTTFSMHFI